MLLGQGDVMKTTGFGNQVWAARGDLMAAPGSVLGNGGHKSNLT